MAKFTSVAAFFRAAHNQRVVSKVIGGYCTEDWPELVKALKRQALCQGIPESAIEVTEDKFEVHSNTGTNPFQMRPKLQRERKGIMVVRSKDFQFFQDGKDAPSYCDKKGLKIEDDKLVIDIVTFGGQKITYEIEE